MKYRKYIKFGFLILSLLLIGIGFSISDNRVMNKLLVILGVILMGGSIAIKRWWLAIISIVVIFLFIVGVDYLVTFYMEKVPVFSIKQVTNEQVISYNSFFYRVYSCDNDLKVDNFYRKNYLCNDNSLEENESNAFINQIVRNYDEWENKFVKIRGRVSRITGIETLEMKAYEVNMVTINGYVTFADNITLKFEFNGNNELLSNYEVYDDAIVIGRVSKLEKEGDNYTVIFKDSKLVTHSLYDDYDLVVVAKDKCSINNGFKLLESDSNYEIYDACQNTIMARYSEDVVYELGFLLNSDKLVIDDVLEKSDSVDYDDKNDVLYSYQDFNILLCKDEKNRYYIGSSELNFDSGICS